VLALATVWALLVPQPDILVSSDGHNVAVRGRDGRLHLMRSAKDAFLIKEWLAADADPRTPTDASLPGGVACDDSGCVTQLPDGEFVTLALQPDALADDCQRAALIVTAKQPPSDCAALITLDRLRRQGTLALRKTRDGFAVAAVKPNGFDRPWAPAVSGDADPELVRRPMAPVDATPAESDLQSED
jgi:competence protein ComEC